jgi:hypothetical protein
MSNTTKKKLNAIRRPLVREVLLDAIDLLNQWGYLDSSYVGIHEEHPVMLNLVTRLSNTIENQYKKALPKKQPAVKQTDLEDLIATIKKEQI